MSYSIVPDNVFILSDIKEHERDLMEYGKAFQEDIAYKQMINRFCRTFGENDDK